MFFNYLSGKYHIPLELFNSWKKIAEFKDNVNVIEKERYLKKEIKEILLDENLAEVIGVLNGDGHISKNRKEICVVGNKNEKEYSEYLQNLFHKKLQIDFHLFFYGSCFKLKGYSVKLTDFFTKNYGLPKGNKMGKLHIPYQILVNKEFLIRYIRGLFDTDGSFYIRRKKDPVIEISSADDRFLKEITKALFSLGFNVSKGVNRLFIYRKNDIIKFYNVIKPSNSKHLKKYQNTFK
ncbi:hypothetical protein J4422_01710 [Candidatus Pacearchaeota archaeon]|nr:hypothetical protein [Candidatus Pacearchaeota archaeon]